MKWLILNESNKREVWEFIKKYLPDFPIKEAKALFPNLKLAVRKK